MKPKKKRKLKKDYVLIEGEVFNEKTGKTEFVVRKVKCGRCRA